MSGFAFSGDGWYFVVGREKEQIEVCDAVTGAVVRRCNGRPLHRFVVSLSTKGRVLAAALFPRGDFRRSGLLQVWDVATGNSSPRVELDVAISHLAVSPDGTNVATAMLDGTILVWDTSMLVGSAQEALPGPLSSENLTELWDQCGKKGPAYLDAVSRLASRPSEAMPFLKRQLRPTPELPPASVRQLFEDSQSAKEEVQASAVAKLTALPTDLLRLQAASAPTASAAQRQLVRIVALQPWYQRAPDALRRVRGVQVLEKIGSHEARDILREMTTGWPLAWDTYFARAALRRLESQSANESPAQRSNYRPPN
jgi:hypothetical protein